MKDQPDSVVSEESNHDFARFSKLYADHQGKVSDKWSAYLELYDRVFRNFERQQISLLEIGVQNGGSLGFGGSFLGTQKQSSAAISTLYVATFASTISEYPLWW